MATNDIHSIVNTAPSSTSSATSSSAKADPSKMLLSLVQDFGQVVEGAQASQSPVASQNDDTLAAIEQSILSEGSLFCNMIISLLNDASTHAKNLSAQGQALLTKIQADMQYIQNQIAELQREEAESSKWGALGSIFGKVLGCLMMIIGAITLQPELVVAGGIAFAMSFSNVSEAILGGLTQMLEKMGVPSSAAPIVAAALFAVLVALVTMGAGAGTAAIADAFSSGSEAGAESAADVDLTDAAVASAPTAAGDGAAGGAEGSSSTGTTAKTNYENYSFGKGFRFGLINGAMAGGLPEQIVSTAVPSSAQNQWWSVTLVAVLTVLLMIMAVANGANAPIESGSGSGAAADGGDASSAKTDIGSQILDTLRKMQSSLQEATQGVFNKASDGEKFLMLFVKNMAEHIPQYSMMIAQAVMQLYQGQAQGIQGETYAQMAPVDQQNTFLQVLQQMLSTNQSTYQSVNSKQVDAYNNLISGLYKILGAQDASGNILISA